jgi:hypothetical protein
VIFDRAQTERAATLAALLPYVPSDVAREILESDDAEIDTFVAACSETSLAGVVVEIPTHWS